VAYDCKCDFAVAAFLEMQVCGFDPKSRTFFGDKNVDIPIRSVGTFFRGVGARSSNTSGFSQHARLSFNCFESPAKYGSLPPKNTSLEKAHKDKKPCKYFQVPFYLYVCIALICLLILNWGSKLIVLDTGTAAGGIRLFGGILIGLRGLFVLGSDLSALAFGNPVWFWTLHWLNGEAHDKDCDGEWHGVTVTQKLLTMPSLCNTLIAIGRSHMANVLSIDKQVAIISAFAEGSGIRQIERMTGVHLDTIMRLGVRVGKGCISLMDGDTDNPKKPKRYVTALHIAPILSAEAAVKAAIVQEFRSLESTEEA
jgi:hypothetical protein